MGKIDNTHYEMFDDFLDKHHFEFVKQYLTSSHFPWYFQPAVAMADQETLEEFYFTHMLFNADTRIRSSFYSVIKPILEKLNVATLIRVKANLYTNLGHPLVHKSHVDFPFEHIGAIFYINTNNGCTVLDNGVQIESKENRLLIFDASKPHQSTHCTDQKVRININFNYFGV